MEARKQNSRFDEWNEGFDFNRWMKVFEKVGLDPEFYARRETTLSEHLPWDHLDVGRPYGRSGGKGVEWQKSRGGRKVEGLGEGRTLQHSGPRGKLSPVRRDDPLHVPPGAFTAGGLGEAARRVSTLGELGCEPGWGPVTNRSCRCRVGLAVTRPLGDVPLYCKLKAKAGTKSDKT